MRRYKTNAPCNTLQPWPQSDFSIHHSCRSCRSFFSPSCQQMTHSLTMHPDLYCLRSLAVPAFIYVLLCTALNMINLQTSVVKIPCDSPQSLSPFHLGGKCGGSRSASWLSQWSGMFLNSWKGNGWLRNMGVHGIMYLYVSFDICWIFTITIDYIQCNGLEQAKMIYRNLLPSLPVCQWQCQTYTFPRKSQQNIEASS